MNFGAFAGGFAQGAEAGLRISKNIRELIREGKIDDLRQKGMEEAQGARTAAVNGMVTEAGDEKAVAPPKSGPVEPPTEPAVVVAPPAAASTGNPYDPGDTRADPQPVAASGLPPSVSTQSPSQEPAGASPPAAAGGASPAQTAPPVVAPGPVVQPTPQTTQAAAPASTAGVVAAGMPAPAVPVAQGGKFLVNGKGYATREEALKAADASAPSTLDFFMKTAVPKIQEAYLVQGDPAKADAWGTWAANKKNQQSMQEWSGMYRTAQMGDMEKAAEHAFKLYKSYDDGVTPLSKETVKDKEGNVTGFNVRLKNDASGEITAQFIDRKAMVEMGLAALSPDKMFEATYQRQNAADKAVLDAKIKRGEKAAEFQDNLTLKGAEADRIDQRWKDRDAAKLTQIDLTKKLDAANLGTKEKVQAQAKLDMLRDAGYTDQQINAMVPSIVGAGDHKKTTDPSERRALIASDLMKNDPTFSRLPVADRNKKVDEMMGVIYNDTAPSSAPGGKTPGTTTAATTPKAPAIGASGQPPSYVRDTMTGQVYRVDNGVRTPVGSPRAGPAGGMPAR